MNRYRKRYYEILEDKYRLIEVYLDYLVAVDVAHRKYIKKPTKHRKNVYEFNLMQLEMHKNKMMRVQEALITLDQYATISNDPGQFKVVNSDTAPLYNLTDGINTYRMNVMSGV
jgi:hypothetical protein